MKGLRTFGIAVAVVMAAVIVWAGIQQPIGENFATITDLPWGVVSLVDLYLGLAIIGVWVVYRESTLVGRLSWIIALVVLGNLAAGAYLALAAHQAIAAGDVAVLLTGKRSP